MESGSMMLLHSVVIGIVLYLVMVYVLKQPMLVAQDRSIFYAALILIYMIAFGHGLPTKINPNIF
jgi:hypothetical protein